MIHKMSSSYMEESINAGSPTANLMVYLCLFNGKFQPKMDDDWGHSHDLGKALRDRCPHPDLWAKPQRRKRIPHLERRTASKRGVGIPQHTMCY